MALRRFPRGPARRLPVRRGLVAGLLAVALGVGAAAYSVDRFVLGAEWWQVRHSVTDAPVRAQLDLGPPPGPLAVSWERSERVPSGGAGAVAYAVADGQAVAVSGHGLDVRDARTGAARWGYRRIGWTLAAWATTGTRIVASFVRGDRRGDRQTVAFDALSGGVLWRRSGDLPASAARETLRWPAGSGNVVTTGPDRAELYGRSAATGDRRWTLPLPRGCRLFEDAAQAADATETIVAVALDCAGGGRLLALDPATGRSRWVRDLGPGGAPQVAVRGGAVLAADGTALRAFAADGSTLAVWKGDDVCGDTMCPAVLVDGGPLIVAYQPAADDDGDGTRSGRIEAVDPGSGRSLWRRDAPAYAALAAAGGAVYALRPRLADALLPAGIDVVSPGDGSVRPVPAPFVLDPALDGVRPWLAAAGGLLYAAVPEAAPRPTGAARLVALRGGQERVGPAELGGVPPHDWPDACALLGRADLAAVRMPAHRVAAEHVTVGGTRLPRPVSCLYTPKEPAKGAPAGGWGESPLLVSVRWVAPDGGAASGMLDALQAVQAQARRRGDVGADEAYELGPLSGTVALRVDRTVVVVQAARPQGAAVRLARAVAARLRAMDAPRTGRSGDPKKQPRDPARDLPRNAAPSMAADGRSLPARPGESG
ncbi:PQQ-binding-like beta-propeller repeat protein [Actinomadura atramentaria]|uniref:outer membrane protein assembly factor BamB family protein n=1 Tax=Actinomadura atramentaria TaxID=1990 RepID=UPI000363085F|nr:PQQ-binding-like beta-propeller repeat protein [Actinomadura atramentaria]